MAVSMELLVLAAYGALAGLYLLAMPAIVYAYLNARWYVASSFERAFMYFLVTFFFPGMLLLAPFINLRPQPRSLDS
ncbi:MAG: photosynthetic/respiratory NAD(P)H-quinone oxidoreductase subunit L [Thermosynechococcus sp.]|uniref:photosynthetic/respiratory NAD(P)H-quinone oxidoreductase subunit L n=1 Tax=Thermosynechococcus sp. TaxID=2814275 RepID=UPI003919AC2B